MAIEIRHSGEIVIVESIFSSVEVQSDVYTVDICSGLLSGFAVYEGPYSVRPAVDSQTLPTAMLGMRYDLDVEPIPYYQTTNEAGGYTAIIGE